MGNKPNIIYTDGETGIRNHEIFKMLRTILQIYRLKTHPYFVEVMLLTFKTMLDNRLENDKDSNVQWTTYISYIIDI